MPEPQEAVQTKKIKGDPALQVLDDMRSSFQGMEQAARQMAQASAYPQQEYTYWGVVKRTMQVCSVAVPIGAVALACTLWAMRKIV